MPGGQTKEDTHPFPLLVETSCIPQFRASHIQQDCVLESLWGNDPIAVTNGEESMIGSVEEHYTKLSCSVRVYRHTDDSRFARNIEVYRRKYINVSIL